MSKLFQNQEIVSKFNNKMRNNPYKNYSDHYARLKKIKNNRYFVLPKSLKNLHYDQPAYISKAKLSQSIDKSLNHSISISFNGEQTQRSQKELEKKMTFIKIVGKPNLIKIKEKMQRKIYSILQPIKIKKQQKKQEQKPIKKEATIIVQKICFKAKQQKQIFSNLRTTKKYRFHTQAIQSLHSEKLNLNNFYTNEDINMKILSPSQIRRGISFKKQMMSQSKTSTMIQKKVKSDYIQPWQQSQHYQTESNENQYPFFQCYN